MIGQRLEQTTNTCVAVTSIERFNHASTRELGTVATSTGSKGNSRLAVSAELSLLLQPICKCCVRFFFAGRNVCRLFGPEFCSISHERSVRASRRDWLVTTDSLSFTKLLHAIGIQFRDTRRGSKSIACKQRQGCERK